MASRYGLLNIIILMWNNIFHICAYMRFIQHRFRYNWNILVCGFFYNLNEKLVFNFCKEFYLNIRKNRNSVAYIYIYCVHTVLCTVSICVRGFPITKTGHIKISGIILDEKLNFKLHVEHVCNRLACAIGVVRSFSQFVIVGI